MERVQRLANLGDAAPESGGAFAYVGFAEHFVLGAEEPGHDDNDEEQGYGNQEFALHAALPEDAEKKIRGWPHGIQEANGKGGHVIDLC